MTPQALPCLPTVYSPLQILNGLTQVIPFSEITIKTYNTVAKNIKK